MSRRNGAEGRELDTSLQGICLLCEKARQLVAEEIGPIVARAQVSVNGARTPRESAGSWMDGAMTIKHLDGPGVHLALEWAREEGWNPGVHDASAFYAADPDGFLAVLHRNAPAAVISMVRYGTSYAFLGLYICRPDLRGQGFGLRVWNAAMALAGDRVIGLDGVPDQQANYAKSGFSLAWQNARYLGRGGGVVRPEGLVDLDAVPFVQVAAFDRGVFEAERIRFLRSWIAQPDAVRLGVMRNGSLAGWGLMRRCVEGWKIGPLMANDAETATRLLDGFLASAPDENISLDIPLPNEAAVQLATGRGMEPVFSTARMYKGTPPQLDLNRIWGVSSFELG